MSFYVDHNAHLIRIESPVTEVSAQDLHDFIEDYMAHPGGIVDDDILSPEGKIEDPNQPGVYSQIIIVLNALWQIQFWPGSGYTRIYGGKIVGGLNDQPMKATGAAGDITVLESPVDGVTVAVDSGSGVTPGDVNDIAAAVWQEVMEAGYSYQQILQGVAAILLGKVDGGGTGIENFRDMADTINRVISENDASGNRTSVTLNVP